jgi:hypothetical protein
MRGKQFSADDTGQASFAEKVTWTQQSNNRFFALLGYDREFDLSVLDVKQRIRRVALGEDPAVLPVVLYCSTFTNGGKEEFGIKTLR